jgi:hypothetical protein
LTIDVRRRSPRPRRHGGGIGDVERAAVSATTSDPAKTRAT